MKIQSLLVLIIVVGCSATNLEEELKITYEQKFAIDKLRQRVGQYLTEDYMKEDLHLLRWLRATKFNIDEAQKRIIENVKWRRQYKIAKINQEHFEDLYEEFPYIFTVDKQGQPTFIGFAGEWDVRGAVMTGRAPRIIRYAVKAMEGATRLIREMQFEGKNVTRANLIIDLNGFSIAQHGCTACLFRILEFLLIYDNNYPGVVDRAIFTNTPPTVAAAVQLIRSNANSETWKAIRLYGMDRKVWRKALLDFIDNDQLPTQLGGIRERSTFSREL